MPEAEVSLRLAFYLLENPKSDGRVEVAIDPAMIKIVKNEIFPLRNFLKEKGWEKVPTDPEKWQGEYHRDGKHLLIHSRPGVGDVVGKLGTRRSYAECKGGPIIKKKGGKEYPILREVLGQLLTAGVFVKEDMLVAAVPDTPKFRQLADAWKSRPLVSKCGIQIALVGRCGSVSGLDV